MRARRASVRGAEAERGSRLTLSGGFQGVKAIPEVQREEMGIEKKARDRRSWNRPGSVFCVCPGADDVGDDSVMLAGIRPQRYVITA